MATPSPSRKNKFRKFKGKKSAQLPEEELDYKNLTYLQSLLSKQGKLFSHKRTRFSGIHQKQFAEAVKRARFLGLLS
jgi:ribosomal protein S18